MTIKKFSLIALLAAFQMSASAQEAKEEVVMFKPHWYLQAQAGVSHTRGEICFGDLLSPSAQVAVGYKFNKVLSVRLHGDITQGKGGMVTPDAKYSFNSAGAGLDLHADLSALLCGYNPNRVFNVGAFLGGGANIAWHNGRANRLADMGYELLYVWDGTKVRPFGRAGVDVNFRISDRVSLGLEGNANIISDKFNSKNGENVDWYFNALAGVKIALGKTCERKEAPVPVQTVAPKAETKPVVVTKPVEKKVETVAEVKDITVNLFFDIRSAQLKEFEMAKLNQLISYLKDNPSKSVTITGYADRGTGNANVNKRYSEQRAITVKDALVNAGIAASRIKIEALGDTSQPFSDNDSNRVCVCISE